jgi:hypothetical protein
VHKVEAIANDNEGELVCEFGFLQEILDFFWVVKVAFATDALDFTDLACPGGGLDILEVDFGILTQIDHRAKVVVQPLEGALMTTYP